MPLEHILYYVSFSTKSLMHVWASQVILSAVSCSVQYLVKPPVKESTMPVDLMLHSDLRAMERTEFDQQVHL